MKLTLALLFVLSFASATLLPSVALSRRTIVQQTASTVFVAAPAAFVALPAWAAPPTDFEVKPEPTRPFIYYLANAQKLANNLEWYANGDDSKEWRQVGAALDDQITAFSTAYGSRPGALIGGGPQPGMSQLTTAYDALAYHFSRYGDDSSEPLPEQLKGTINRNVKEARTAIKRAVSAAAAAAA